MGRYVVAITGASGSAYGLRLVERLLAGSNEVVLVMTQAGADVMAYELEFDLPAEEPGRALLRYLELSAESPLRVAYNCDMFDPIASGSHKIDGMVVVPASMGFCASIAAGMSSDLAERAADVMLKERRPLIMVPRETPLSLVHLRNLTALAEVGVLICPAMPAFYHKPATLDDQVNFVVGKILDLLGQDHSLFERWGT